MRSLYILTLIGCISFLNSCEVVDFITGYGQCSAYNDIKDKFQIDVIPARIVMEKGAETTIDVTRSWLNLNLERVPLACAPSWSYDPPGIVVVQEDVATVSALAPGITKITAIVTGPAGTKTDTFWAAVVPLSTEEEPNNGIAAANRISINSSKIGYINYSEDTDWFYADVPPSGSFQFTLLPAVNVTNTDPFSRPNYSGRLYTSDGEIYGDVNIAYHNSSSEALRVFAAVWGSAQDPIPYELSFDLVY